MSKILANQIANYLDNAPIEIKEGLNIPSGKPLQVGGSTGTNGQVLSTNGTGLVWADAPYFSGSYNDLTNQPTIPAPQVNADWNAASGVAVILNKPAIPPQSTVTIGPASGGGSLIYNNITGEFTFTPPNLSSFSTFSGNYNDLNNKPDLSSYLTSYTETDPVFSASPVASVTGSQVTNWNTAYGWGNHASAGYLTTESDTLATVVARGGTTTGNIQVNDLTVSGNFSVIGTSTTNNVATLNVTANQIIMNDGVTGAPSLNGVLKVERGTSPDSEFRWNETSDRWEFTNDGTNYYNLATGTADIPNTAGFITTYTETDPIFGASAAAGIGASDIADWNTAYGWGNHAAAGYLTTESDTLDSVTSRGATTSNSVTVGPLTVNGNLTVTGTTTQINTTQLTVSDNTIVLNNDVSTTPTENAGIEVERGLSSNVRLRWNEATDRWTFTNDGSNYFVMPTSIGDLANDVGYLTSYTETDPIFSASVAAGITSGELSNWNAAYNWGNHASAGYLTGLSGQSIGGLGDVTVSGPATGELLRYNATSSKWENWSPNYLTTYTEIDPIFVASPAYGISNSNINNWNTAFSWGNHASAGYLTTLSTQSLGSLSNVSSSTPSDGQALVWNASGNTWQPGTVSGGGGGSYVVPTQDDAPLNPTDGTLWWESDTAKLKVYYDDGNTSQWVDASPAGGGTAESDTLQTVTARGATTTDAITTGGINVGTNVDINLGNSNEFNLTYDSSNYGVIRSNGDGLVLRSNVFQVKTWNNSEVYLTAYANSGVTLYYDNVAKFATTTNGATITGALTAGGLTYPTSNGTSGQVLTSDGAGNVVWGSSSAEADTLDTVVSRGASTSTQIIANGGLKLGDDQVAQFGSGSTDALEIYHNSTIGRNYIDSNSDLWIRSRVAESDIYFSATDDIFLRVNSGQNAIVATGGGSVGIYYSNEKKFETTTEGVTITGSVGNNNLQVDGDALVIGGLNAGGLSYPQVTGTAGQILTSDGAGNVEWQNVSVSTAPVAVGYINMIGSYPTWTGTAGYTVAHSGGGGSDEVYTLTFPVAYSSRTDYIVHATYDGTNWIAGNGAQLGIVRNAGNVQITVRRWNEDPLNQGEIMITITNL